MTESCLGVWTVTVVLHDLYLFEKVPGSWFLRLPDLLHPLEQDKNMARNESSSLVVHG